MTTLILPCALYLLGAFVTAMLIIHLNTALGQNPQLERRMNIFQILVWPITALIFAWKLRHALPLMWRAL